MYHNSIATAVKTVLVVDEVRYAERLRASLARLTGARVITATDLTPALRAIEEHCPDAVVSGLPMTDEVGVPLLFWVSLHQPGLPVVVVLDEAEGEGAQQAQWFGAQAVLTRSSDPGALADDVAALFGLEPVVDIWDRVAEVAARRHLSLVVPAAENTFDAHACLAGLFRGLGTVRGLRGSLLLDENGSFMSMVDTDGSLDVSRMLPPLQGFIRAGHAACVEAGLDQCETAVLRTGHESLVVSCCVDTDTHVHVVTMIASDGNRALVELAHKRLQRDFHEVGGVATSQRSAAEMSA
ncbi:MAG TPA: response regulator [Propionibacteriaceae bacterium]|nr:response regulator [Propionibacteriaceae bacterium]